MIEAIVSDWGGVLTSPLAGSFGAFAQESGIGLEALGSAMARIAERDGENPLFPLERGEITEPQFNAVLEAELEAALGRRVSMARFSELFIGSLDVNEPMLSFLAEARSAHGVRLALLTNNVREWEPRWRAMMPVDELFEVVVDSAYVGIRKPDPRIYAIVLERLGLPAQACAFVDDLEHNVVAARELGMHAVWFQDTEQAIAELEAQLSPPSRSQR
ncbi:MAG: HAD-superfamily hydrolase, subfamily variant 3 [Solirubrobacterales bacterium]|jgi:putative hydrolase of the HAD superfamily|nr:HAD-superfamily hydrolase, subfamily variant 3 [Solirubrobacterales bacterium]